MRLSERAAQLGGHFTRRSAPTTRPTQWVDRGWYLVLEFEDTTSDKLDRALRIARRHRVTSNCWTKTGRLSTASSTGAVTCSCFGRSSSGCAIGNRHVYVNGNPVSLEYLWPESPALML
ncbi:MAG: hypothetical protein HZY76_01660 [Anaerolineae bacterium]|nr:MAG: hypothetical protein HZY76_01660 [Anaerolineae bacterium]